MVLFNSNWKVKMLLVERLIATEKRKSVSVNKSNWEFSGICKKKLSINGLCCGKVFTAPVCWKKS